MKKFSGYLIAVLIVTWSGGGTGWAEKNRVAPEMGMRDASSRLTLRNADLQDVLRMIAEEYDLNIVMSDDVAGTVTLRLKGASLVNTLDALLLSRGLDYDIRDNIIRVALSEVIEAERSQRQSKQELEPLVPEVVVMKYLDANDVEPVVKSLLTSRGSVRVLERRAFKGFQFGTQTSGTQGGSSGSSGSGSVQNAGDLGGLVRSRAGGEEQKPRSNTLMIVDVRAQIDRIMEVINKVDVPPRQVLIDTRILEVDTDTLEDIGLDFNSANTLGVDDGKSNDLNFDFNSSSSSTGINSGIFSDTFPGSTDSGVHAVFRRLNGEDFTVILHALLQDERTKTLSAPKILTIENQEAAILVGEQFPIFESNVTDSGTTTETLSFFQPIGISLQVIAQVTAGNDVSLIVHPTVSSVGTLVTGTSGLTQPRINIREADTRVQVRDGETLVIGGLLEDVVREKDWGIPILKDIPLIGRAFSRKQVDVDQRNLLIFITPHVLVDGQSPLSEQETMTLQGIQDPARYGFLQNRREAVARIYEAARRNFSGGHREAAKAQFLRLYAIDPHHEGAVSYLKKMDALPAERPVG